MLAPTLQTIHPPPHIHREPCFLTRIQCLTTSQPQVYLNGAQSIAILRGFAHTFKRDGHQANE